MAVVMTCLRAADFAATAASDAENREIVGFGAAAGENDLGRLRAEQCGDRFARAVHGGARALPGGVNRAGVAEILGEIRQHGVEDGVVHGRRGVVIEIGAHGSGHLQLSQPSDHVRPILSRLEIGM